MYTEQYIIYKMQDFFTQLNCSFKEKQKNIPDISLLSKHNYTMTFKEHSILQSPPFNRHQISTRPRQNMHCLKWIIPFFICTPLPPPPYLRSKKSEWKGVFNRAGYRYLMEWPNSSHMMSFIYWMKIPTSVLKNISSIIL